MNIIQRTPEEVFALWTEALCSGKFMQGRERLRTRGVLGRVDTYCCLGVLCELCARDGGPKWGRDGEYEGTTTTLPFRLRRFLGLAEHEVSDLIGLNDGDKCTFYHIAAHINRVLVPAARKRRRQRDAPKWEYV